MKVPVYVFPDTEARFPKLTYARVHRENAAMGEVKGTSFAYAERREQEPKLIFLIEDHVGERGELVIVSAAEGYRLDNDDPTYNITKTWYAVALSDNQRAPYAGPDELLYASVEADLPGFE